MASLRPLTDVRPRRGGTRLYCPVVLVAVSEPPLMCDWPSRRQTRGGLHAWRRHFRQVHLAAFRHQRDAQLRYVQNISFDPARRPVPAEVVISKGSYASDGENWPEED